VLDGTITQEQRQVLQHQLDDLLANSQIASWFSPEWDVRTEIPIIVPDGSENRIDRLLLKGRKAIVVDFKTGEPTKADQKQVQEYIGILRQMNYADVEGYLLYIKDKEIVSVLPGKIKTAGKKDKQQLDLGF
jgi:ATP-dependent exoDNAse (exonuclease V) beta subunit